MILLMFVSMNLPIWFTESNGHYIGIKKADIILLVSKIFIYCNKILLIAVSLVVSSFSQTISLMFYLLINLNSSTTLG